MPCYARRVHFGPCPRRETLQGGKGGRVVTLMLETAEHAVVSGNRYTGMHPHPETLQAGSVASVAVLILVNKGGAVTWYLRAFRHRPQVETWRASAG